MRNSALSLLVVLGFGCGGSGTFGGGVVDDDDTRDDGIPDDDDDDATTTDDDDDDSTTDDDDSDGSPYDAGLDDLLARTFRIDISRIDVAYDFTPGADTVLGEATLTFTMRPGQVRPAFHYTPWEDVQLQSIVSLRLDGELLDPGDPADVIEGGFPGSSQPVIELQRDVDPAMEHVLEVDFALPNWWDEKSTGWFFTDVSDIAGDGNEFIFPTINAPDELARHVIELRVHSDAPYRVLGSGLVEQRPGQPGLQRWTLDTEREVASYTVLLVAAPDAEVDWEERVVAGVPIRIASIASAAELDQAFDDAEAVLSLLASDFGPLPMARGISVLLTDDYGGGMEYFGGTISDGWALQHELVHMYFGCSTIARTWRDSWWDEAINIWYLWPGSYDPINATFSSNIVSGRTPVQPAFDTRAYDEGAAIFDEVADRIGGRQALIEVLRTVRDEHTFAPFSTGDLILFIEAETGVDLTDEFGRWVYGL